MRALLLAIVAFAAGCAKADEFTAEKAKALIPEAAGHSPFEAARFYGFAGDPMKFRPANGHSLTWVVMATYVPGPDAPQNPTSFKYLGDAGLTTNSSVVAKAKSGPNDKDGKHRTYVSLIHPEYITDCTCKVEDDTATGVVSFRAENVYEGMAEYTARRKDGKWRIEEFRMPDLKITVALGDDGKWVKK